MSLKISKFVIILISLITQCSYLNAGDDSAATSTSGIVRRVLWQKLLAEKIRFQHDLHEIAIDQWPELTTSFTNYRDFQLTLIERKRMILDYYAKKEPQKIDVSNGLNGYLNFHWDASQNKVFRKKIQGFKEIESSIMADKSRIESDAAFALMNDAFKRIRINPRYVFLMKGMARSLAEAQIILNRAKEL